jgi:carboxylate-amine ligase
MNDFTVGTEEEYQLVDAATGDLQSRARSVLATDWTGELRNELQESTVEIGTKVCDSAADVEQELKRLRLQTATAAAAEGLDIIAAGLHPTGHWESHRLTKGERYARIAEQYGRLARDEHNFGMHIHVAVPASTDRIALLNAVRHYLPHLLALSGSSPFFEAADTGYASFRMILWRRWPGAGVPPHFASGAEYRAHVELLLRSGAIGDERNLYWSVRPHPEYPTLEFRVSDVCPSVDDAAAIAALARAIVAAAAAGLLPQDLWPRTSTDLAHGILATNEWRAARFGLDATLVDPTSDSASTHVQVAIHRLLECVAPAAEANGDAAVLDRIARIIARGSGADRMRRRYRESGEFGPVIAWLVEETLLGCGLDRRCESRSART